MQDPPTDSTNGSSPPLLELDDARIECDSGLLLDGVHCRAVGDRVALVGPWDALFRLLGGGARLVAGAARISGDPIPSAVATGTVGVALQDAPFPPRWKGLDYLVQSARLAGCGGNSDRRARALVEQLGLSRLAGRRLQVMAPAERRAILIAHALVTEPATLALEAPLDDLDQASVGSLSAVIERAAVGRRLLVSVCDAAHGGPARGLLDTMDSALTLGPWGEIDTLRVDGLSPAGGRRYVVAVPRQTGPFAAELSRRGVEIESLQGPNTAAPAVVAPPELEEQTGRLVVRLSEGVGTDAILDASLALDLPILHLAPAELAVAGERDREKC